MTDPRKSQAPRPAVVLVHGAYADGSSWSEDRTIAPDLQRFLAQRMQATTVEIDAGHLSLITHPDEVTQLIMSAVRG